jgi:hypothetical protein
MNTRWSGRLHVWSMVSEGTSMAKEQTSPPTEAAVTSPEKFTGELRKEWFQTPLAYGLALALQTNWKNKNKTDLASAANTSTQTIYRVLTGQISNVTTAVNDLLDALGVDSTAAAKGRYAAKKVDNSEVHAQLDSILNSPAGDLIRAQISAAFHTVIGDNRKR